MAPFTRGRGSSRAFLNFQSRGGGRGRGRGRGNAQTHGNIKSTFLSSRVEEPLHSDSGESNDSPKLDDDEDGSVTGSLSSTSEDEIAANNTVKPYSILLESLNASNQPQRKKRKIEDRKDLDKEDDLNQNLDLVEEPEETAYYQLDDAEDVDEPDDADDNDPFIRHFAGTHEMELALCISDVKNHKWLLAKAERDSNWSYLFKYPSSLKHMPLTSSNIPRSTQEIYLKEKLKLPAAKCLPVFNDLTGNLAQSIFNYRDILFTHRSINNADDLRKITCLHLLNHIIKTRDKVIKNNSRLSKENHDEDLELRDQGFTRPKVLVILPTRQSCVRYVDTIISLYQPEQQENRKRFLDSYAQSEDDLSEDKPADFRELFGGNDDDMFRIGMKFTRKTVKYFAQFYNSDIIFASPLGLRMALGAEDVKKQDHDFLSSIELLIVDQADALIMQNWEHVEYIFDHLNLQPKEAHGCDFSRVRGWYLDGNAKYLRQTILLSAFNFPSLNKLFASNVRNVAGKVKLSRPCDGAMLDLGITLKQTFSRYESTSPVTDPDDRFKYFISSIVPSLTKYSDSGGRRGQGILIYFPLYAEFVRVRNYLASSSGTQSISFGSISDYTSVRDVARARSHFFTGRYSVLLYTERAHHFRRYHLRGVKEVIMYGLPDNPIFYREIAGGFLGSSIAEAKVEASEANVRSLFSRLDVLRLERTVGTKRHLSLLRNKGGDTFDFV